MHVESIDFVFSLTLQGSVDTSGISSISVSPYVSSVVALGLSTFDKLTGSAQPNLMLDVSVNSTDILKVGKESQDLKLGKTGSGLMLNNTHKS